jgi:hypothetical protein
MFAHRVEHPNAPIGDASGNTLSCQLPPPVHQVLPMARTTLAGVEVERTNANASAE